MLVELIKLLDEGNYSFEDKKLILNVYAVAYEEHKNQKRKSGEDYISHPLAVAIILASYHADVDSICAGLLHDIVEDCGYTFTEIKERFNETIAFLVDGLTKFDINSYDGDVNIIDDDNFKKLLTFGNKDIRVIMIKLADRLHNMKTIAGHSDENRKKIAKETIKYYVPLARLIGATEIKNELEELCFKCLYKDEYTNILNGLITTINESAKSVNEVVYILDNLAVESRKKVSIKQEIMSCHEIYEYMLVNGINPSNISSQDIANIPNLWRVYLSVDNEEDLKFFTDKIKIYYLNPKENYNTIGYKYYEGTNFSIVGKNNISIQLFVQTKLNQEIFENGLMSYWNVKSDNLKCDGLTKELDELGLNAKEYCDAVLNDVFGKKIHVNIEEKGTFTMPEGATVSDLVAYLNLLDDVAVVIMNNTYAKWNEKLIDGANIEFNYDIYNNGVFGGSSITSDYSTYIGKGRYLKRKAMKENV